MSAPQSVQCFGKKKTATAVAHCKKGKGLIKVNGQPLSLVQPEILRFKVSIEHDLALLKVENGSTSLRRLYETTTCVQSYTNLYVLRSTSLS